MARTYGAMASFPDPRVLRPKRFSAPAARRNQGKALGRWQTDPWRGEHISNVGKDLCASCGTGSGAGIRSATGASGIWAHAMWQVGGAGRCAATIWPRRFNCSNQERFGSGSVFRRSSILPRPERDFAGGEFVLIEWPPPLQSRVEVVSQHQGDSVAFAVRSRQPQGAKGRSGYSGYGRSGQQHPLRATLYHPK